MIFLIARLVSMLTREKPVQLKAGVRYLATLDMTKVRPSLSAEDARAYLMKMGFTPTTRADMWKVGEQYLSRLPKAAVLKADKL